MSRIFSLIFATGFTLMQVISIDFARGGSIVERHNDSHYSFQWKSDRMKRSPPEVIPQRLRLLVELPTRKKIKLNLMKKQNYLANEFLPVVTSDLSVSNVMSILGKFEVYQDIEKCSAFVYFKKDNALYGVVGLNHAILNLPLDFGTDSTPTKFVGSSLVSKRSGVPVHNDPLLFDLHTPSVSSEPSTCSVVGGYKRQSDSDPDPSNKHQRTERDVNTGFHEGNRNMNKSMIRNRRGDSTRERYFLEILIFITSDVVEFFKSLYRQYNIEWVVRFYIIYFNAVDTIFKQQRTSEFGLQINIAKIVIEDIQHPFDFIDHDMLRFRDTVVKLREYLKANQHIYTPDSFDHVFIATNRPIMDGSILVGGARDPGIDTYEARKNDEFYRGVPITTVGLFYDYVIAVHEISRTLGIQPDSWVEGLGPLGQCSSIMQEGSSKCDECFRWTEESKEHFRTVFRTNRGRCYLLNEPRSIRPPGISRFISPVRQCQCFGYHSYVWSVDGILRPNVKSSGCSIALKCRKIAGREMLYEDTVPPLDGTNCGSGKVCWNSLCSELDG